MWAALVLALATAAIAGAAEPTNETAVEEKPAVARAKLMVSGGSGSGSGAKMWFLLIDFHSHSQRVSSRCSRRPPAWLDEP